MKQDKFDKKIEEAIKSRIEKNDEYKRVIQNAIKNEKSNKYNILKKVACFLFIAILGTSMVFGKNISAFINSIMRKDSHLGVQEAIDNGYLQHIDVKEVSSNGANVNIKEILMDDYNLSILFDIYVPEIDKMGDICRVNFSNLLITDEQDNVIVADFESSDKYKEFYKERNIASTNKNIAYGDSVNGKILTNYDKNLEYMCIVTSEEFPKSKTLKISFEKIILTTENYKEQKVIDGIWNLTVNLSEEIYNRETLVYNVKSCNIDDIEVTMANVSNTGMKFKITTKWGEPVYDENDSKEEKERKIEEFFNNTHSVQNILIKGEYVENSKGERFYPLQSNDGDGGYNQMLNGQLNYWQTFTLTKYNATDTLKVVMQTKDGKEVIIELINKN